MKIAITVENDRGLESPIAMHFGRSPYFAFVEVEGQQVKAVEVLPNPFAAGHKHGQVPTFIQQQRADVILSGGMGRGAIGFFEQFGIETATGSAENVAKMLEKYFKGELNAAAPCNHSHGEHHH
jgi:predicted Fe-Mo cluster-binding NifX family protein